MASQITSLTIVYSTVYSGADQRKHKVSATGLWAVNSLVTGEFPAQIASNAENISNWWRHHVLFRNGDWKCLHILLDGNDDPLRESWILTGGWLSLIAKFIGPTWDPSGPTGPRWAPCWPHELCYLRCCQVCESLLTNLEFDIDIVYFTNPSPSVIITRLYYV